MKINLVLSLPIPVPGVGWIREFKNTFGGKWNLSFDVSSQRLSEFIDKIHLGDGNILETFLNILDLPSFVSIDNMSYNSNSLGDLASGEIKIDFLGAILQASDRLSIANPVILLVIKILKWLVQEVFNISTGLLVKPKVSSRIESPITTDARVQNLGSPSLEYCADLSKNEIPAILSSTSQEISGNNHFSIDLSPLIYRLFFDVDWDYYFDVNLNVLGLSLYQNNWIFDLFQYPKLSWDACNIRQSVPFDMQLDEPLVAGLPNSNNGIVSIDLSDKSSISKAELKYSLDKSSWQSIPMTSGSSLYSAIPDVPKETPVFYSVNVIDGDGDEYVIDNNGSYFNYILPQSKSQLEQFFSQVPTPIFIAVPIAIFAGITIAIAIKKKSLKKQTKDTINKA